MNFPKKFSSNPNISVGQAFVVLRQAKRKKCAQEHTRYMLTEFIRMRNFTLGK